jgi:hypothetical protein
MVSAPCVYSSETADIALSADRSMAMWSLLAIPATCWLCVLVALPRKPRLGNGVEELVYARLLGRQHLLILLALLVTALLPLTLLLLLPSRGDSSFAAQRRLSRYCNAVAVGLPRCYRLQDDGTWQEAERQADGGWGVVGIVPAPVAQPVPTSGTMVDGCVGDVCNR